MDERNGRQNGNSENMNGELYEIYQKQQKLKQALKDKLGTNSEIGDGQSVLKKMDEIELDLINKGFTNQTLQKMMGLQYQLLKLENATFIQGRDDKRESHTNFEKFSNSSNQVLPKANERTNAVEILNRQKLRLQLIYKRKVQEYFKKENDQF